MWIQLLILFSLLCVGVAISLLFSKSTEAPTVPSYKAPSQLDPTDFGISSAHELSVVVVTSPKCDSCAQVLRELSKLDPSISVLEIVSEDNKELLERYKIDGVPTTMLVDSEGVVEDAFFGPVLLDEIELAIKALKLG